MSENLFECGLFDEPEGFRKIIPEPKFYEYSTKHKNLTLRVVGAHSLWAHYLWNASMIMSKYIDANPDLVVGRNILELGAGAGLPSITCALNGARCVAMTDFPDLRLVDNMAYNVSQNSIPNTHCLGFLWGANEKKLFEVLGDGSSVRFHLILLSDLLFNYSEYDAMLRTCVSCLANDGQVLVTFSSHRPWLKEKELAFFTLAETSYNFHVVQLDDIRVAEPMFADDPGDLEVRTTVHMYTMTQRSSTCNAK